MCAKEQRGHFQKDQSICVQLPRVPLIFNFLNIKASAFFICFLSTALLLTALAPAALRESVYFREHFQQRDSSWAAGGNR